ncbi:MAG: dihydropteroate synthase [Vulcanisaeta sp. AZ3]
MIRGRLGRLWIGDGYNVAIMGVVNVSPESFFKGSIRVTVDDALKTARRMVDDGAVIIDIGGMSTAPYNRTFIPIDEEVRRVVPVVKALRDALPDVTISVDTFRSRVAEEAIKVGADVVNDVTGLKGDPNMVKLIADYGVSVIIMGRETKPTVGLDPVTRIIKALRESVDLALNHGIKEELIIIDPGIGFPPLNLDPVLTSSEPVTGEYRHGGNDYPWYVWDSLLILNVAKIRFELGRPILVGVSRKSFLTKLMGRQAPPEDRLYASISAEAISVIMGADAIRTHNVAETRDAVRVAEKLRQCLNEAPNRCLERFKT